METKANHRQAESPTQRIHRAYGDLPEGERKAADLVLDMPGELAIWSASELADRAKVSNATVSRLFRRLGYSSYEEARRAARSLRAVGSPLYLAESAKGAVQERDFLARHISVETKIVEATLAMVNPLTLDAVSELLAKRRRLRVAGFRNSYFAAEYARTMLAQFRPGIELLNAPGQTLAEGIAGVGSGDVVLVIGLRRRPSGFTEFVRAVAETGADVVLIADRSIREAPAEAHYNLSCIVETPQAVDSYAGVLALLRLLALSVLAKLDAQGRRHLERIETFHEKLSELE
ncbi:SIS domain-containing protein [Stappia sp. GBMRC 2046]|uniref:SIS domain-containing protein n=1 Tax=Stappia sediminis TaxID=2692190 RepID=A0A7X3LSY9_9HYPH|nr:MurR/RpiR family transcriptional regulator [Stappia sediminis]MXN64526.1 SIS domain-containing protein [Stappia sediminis]